MNDLSDSCCQVIGYHIDNIFIDLAQLLLQYGKKVSPRNMETIELRNICFKLTNPKNCVVTLSARNISLEYLQGEMEWYKSGSLFAKDIAKHSSFWDQIANKDGTLNSNYGYIALKQLCPNNKNQLQWCVDKIQNDPDTRQAVINYNQPTHKYEENKDFVCTIAQTFRQHDGVIDTFVHMRSNDLIYGLTYDLIWYCYMLEEICKLTGYKVGSYYHFTESLHVYKRHYEMLTLLAKEKHTQDKKNNESDILGEANRQLQNAEKILCEIENINVSILYQNDNMYKYNAIFDVCDGFHICDIILDTEASLFVFTIITDTWRIEIRDPVKDIRFVSHRYKKQIDRLEFAVFLSKIDLTKFYSDIVMIKQKLQALSDRTHP